MIDYKLALKLKNAGFKQEDWGKWRKAGHIPKYEGNGKDEVLISTLSELIEACGDDFGNLTRDTWGSFWSCNNFQGDSDTQGKTPEEAVAKLWLKLNK